MLGYRPKLSRSRRPTGDSAESDVNGTGDLATGGDPVPDLIGHELDSNDARVLSVTLVYTILEITKPRSNSKQTSVRPQTKACLAV